MRALLLIVLVSGCDDGWHEGDPIDRAVTSWWVLPSADDTRLAITLEPRKVTRHESGVLTTGYSTRIVGPTLAVHADGGEPFATFQTGATHVTIGETRAWLLQADLTTWEHQPPTSGAPREPLVHATVIDRTTFATQPPITLVPPIDIPFAIGDELYDIPASGTSDIARDIYLRHRALDGSATVLHAGRGFASTWCARGDGAILAYQRETGELQLVSVQRDGSVHEAMFAGRLDPRGIACDGNAQRAAAVLETGVSVFDVETAQVVFSAPGTSGPLVMGHDGTTLVSTRPTGGMIVFTDEAGSRDTGAISAANPTPPVIIGYVALFELEHELRVIQLDDGRLGHVIPPLPGEDTPFYFEMKAWPGGFVLFESRYDLEDTDYADHIERIVVIDEAGVTDLPLPTNVRGPQLLVPRGSRAYIRTYDDNDESRLYGYDLEAKTQVLDVPVPRCDEAMVLEERGCR